MNIESARTFLFVPGDRPDRFAKAQHSGADVIIIDLEDAVRAESKQVAAENLLAWIGAGNKAAVRINSLGTPWYEDDLAAIAGQPVSAIVIPKAQSLEELEQLAIATQAPLLPIIETAVGMVRLEQLLAHPAVVRILFGSQDYSTDLGVSPDDAQALAAARSSLVLASRVHGLPGPVDGPTRTWSDPEIVEKDARRARSMGFTGKLCIHPAQLQPTLRGLAPTDDEVAWALKVVGSGNVGGATSAGGEMVDQPVIDRARQILASRATR